MPVSGGKGLSDALIGEVLAVGDDVKLEVAKGDVVIFSKWVCCSWCQNTLCLICSIACVQCTTAWSQFVAGRVIGTQQE